MHRSILQKDNTNRKYYSQRKHKQIIKPDNASHDPIKYLKYHCHYCLYQKFFIYLYFQ